LLDCRRSAKRKRDSAQPHFADGNGYTTEFILFDTSTVTTGQSSVGNLLFFTPAGQPLNLAVR